MKKNIILVIIAITVVLPAMVLGIVVIYLRMLYELSLDFEEEYFESIRKITKDYEK